MIPNQTRIRRRNNVRTATLARSSVVSILIFAQNYYYSIIKNMIVSPKDLIGCLHSYFILFYIIRNEQTELLHESATLYERANQGSVRLRDLVYSKDNQLQV